MTSGTDFDVIFLALARWDAPYSSTALSLAKALSHERRVFYIDNPVTLSEFVRRRDSPSIVARRERVRNGNACFIPDESLPNFIVVTPQLSLPINWLPAGFMYNYFSGVNDNRISEAINAVIRTYGIKRFIFVNSFNPLYGKKLSLEAEPLLTVYQSVDDIRQAPYLEKHGPRLEKMQVANADFTLVTSSYLRKNLSLYSPRVYHLPNAANSALFSRAMTETFARPDVFNSIPGASKIITYIGNICQRLDYALVEKIAKAHPDKFVVLVGPQAARRNSSVTYAGETNLQRLPNVVLTGPRRQEELPAILQHSHCCIIPFLCNDLTKSIYPLKINEYLSAGKPVVSTAFSDDIQSFRPVVTIAENHQQFVNALDKVMMEDTKTRQAERLVYAAGNTWEARAHTFIELAVEFLKHHDRRTGLFQRRHGEQVVSGENAQ